MATFMTIRQMAHELRLPKERTAELAETYCKATIHTIDGRERPVDTIYLMPSVVMGHLRALPRYMVDDPSLRPAVLQDVRVV